MAVRSGQLSRSVVDSLSRFRDRYFSPVPGKSDGGRGGDVTPVGEDDGPQQEQGFLDSLPVDLQFVIMTLLSPADICRLGAASRYWRDLVRDPLLWKYFLIRDMPHWPSIDHVTMPRLEALDPPLGGDACGDTETMHDFMADYLKGCPASRERSWPPPPRPPYEAVTSFLQSLVPSSEPRYAMFGPGMEQLEVSLVHQLMHEPDGLSVAATPQRQINGVGSGISYLYKNQHTLNILTLYSTNRAERERARMEQQSVDNKLFILEGTDQSGCPIFSPAPQVQEVCQVVDGFIYVANAEPGRGGEGVSEGAQIRAVVSPALGSTSRPLLVLSCVARETAWCREDPQQPGPARCRTPCVDTAQRLRLPQLPNPWMVQDTVAESLSGLLDGISWLLSCSGIRLHSS